MPRKRTIEGYQPEQGVPEERRTPPSGGSATHKKEQSLFLTFETRDDKVLYIRPREISALGAHVLDGTQTRIFVKEVVEQLVIKDTPENVLQQILDFERKQKQNG